MNDKQQAICMQRQNICEHLHRRRTKKCSKSSVNVIHTSVEHAARAFGYKCNRLLPDDEMILSPPILTKKTQNL